jgi:hypothetical protein
MGLMYFGDYVVKENTDPSVVANYKNGASGFLKTHIQKKKKKKLKITERICYGKNISSIILILIFFYFVSSFNANKIYLP